MQAGLQGALAMMILGKKEHAEEGVVADCPELTRW
jgi:hypothetical protein